MSDKWEFRQIQKSILAPLIAEIEMDFYRDCFRPAETPSCMWDWISPQRLVEPLRYPPGYK